MRLSPEEREAREAGTVARRQRIVKGSCWPCKKRRLKCDLGKTACQKCLASGTSCSYDKVVLRWSGRPSKNIPRVYDQALLSVGLPAANEKRALDYFETRLWPLLSTIDLPPSPLMSVVLQSTPVRHAACAFAEGHRASYARGLSKDSLMNRRLHCITSIREQLADYSGSREALSPLLLAVLLLYFLDGFVECRWQQQLSVHSHYKGVLAIIEALGGQQAVCSSLYPEASLLLSEFVAADLTEAVLQGRQPYFDAAIWKQIEAGQVWWAVQDVGSQSLASVFGTMASISQYSRHKELQSEAWRSTVSSFESALQPAYSTLGLHGLADLHHVQQSKQACSRLFSQALVRAYQHAALIYLYRVICSIPTGHYLVQQHVQGCLDSVQSVASESRLHNCTSFPLYVAGAHSLEERHRSCVLHNLQSIHADLAFQSVLCIRSALEKLWKEPGAQSGDWSHTFKDFTSAILVI